MTPYDSLETVANMARVRLNDAIVSLGGDILTDNAAFSLTAINNAWRRLQEYLAHQGCAILNREIEVLSVPAFVGTDQGIRQQWNWNGFFDGTNQDAIPVFPQDMIAPLELFERANGGSGYFAPMDQVFNGLPTGTRGNLNRVWEWRQESIYLPGSLVNMDILMRYAGYLSDFVAANITPWANQSVPIMRSANTLAWYICSEVARPRTDMDAGIFDQMAEDSARSIWDREYRQGRSLFNRAELGKIPDQDSALNGPVQPKGPVRVQ